MKLRLPALLTAPCHRWVSCAPSADAAKRNGDGGVLLFFSSSLFFRMPKKKMSGLSGEGRGLKTKKQKLTNCHLIWQLECRFNVLGDDDNLSAKRLFQFSQDDPGTADWVQSSHVAVRLNWVFREVTKWICLCLKYSYDVEIFLWVAKNMTVHFVYSYFYLAHFILLSFYWWGCL